MGNRRRTMQRRSASRRMAADQAEEGRKGSAALAIESSPVLTAQRAMQAQLQASPYVTAQRKSLGSGMDKPAQREVDDEPAQMATEDEPAQMQTDDEPAQLQGDDELAQMQTEDEAAQMAMEDEPAQRQTEDEPAQLQGEDELAQMQTEDEPAQMQTEDEPAQMAMEDEPAQMRRSVSQFLEEPAPRPNNTGLPDNLKAGVESLSGMSLDHVKVHYNSSQPAQLNALAYAQGADIHVGPGQEKHLPHETWHVVQQAKGRVQPTTEAAGMPVNTDPGLEREADVMGQQAVDSSAATATAYQAKQCGDVRQFALPGSYDEAEADGYNPHGKKDTYRSGVTNYARLASSGFTSGWRETMLEYWDSKGWIVKHDNNLYIKEQKQGNWVDVRGIQLDHAKPVATMKDDLRDVNEDNAISAAYSNTTMKDYYHLEDGKSNHVNWPASKTLAKKKLSAGKKSNMSVEPTLHAAKKYYHDKANLVPLTGTDNASKGDDESDVIEWEADDLEVEREWQDMTLWLSYGVKEKDIDEVSQAVDSMNETLGQYGDDWPV